MNEITNRKKIIENIGGIKFCIEKIAIVVIDLPLAVLRQEYGIAQFVVMIYLAVLLLRQKYLNMFKRIFKLEKFIGPNITLTRNKTIKS